MRKFLGLFIFTLLSTSLAFAGQNVEVTHSGLVSATTSSSETSGNSYYRVQTNCFSRAETSGFFADRPGSHKPYVNNSDYYVTICANESNRSVSVDFQQFNLEKFDNITVWEEFRSGAVGATDTPESKDVITSGSNRLNDGIQRLGTFTGPSSPGTLTSRFGCLTFRFVSDKSVVKTGWYAKIGCTSRTIPGPAGCALARYVDSDLKCGVMVKDDNYRGANNFSDYGDCGKKGWPSTGRELIYRFVNHKARDLTFTLEEDNGSQPKLLNMFIIRRNGDGSCSPTQCIGSVVRPAPHYDADRNTVFLENAAPGTYYVVIDGNRVTGHNWFKLRVDCTAGDYTTCSNPYYYDDFEAQDDDVNRPRPDIDYQVGDYITKVNPYWTKSNNVGIRDARISSRRSSNGMNSLAFNRAAEGTQQASLDLGRKFRGAYRICWSMYIERNHTAFFGIFGGDNSDPWGSINKEFSHNSVYQGRWFDVELFVDLDRNDYVLYLDNRCTVFSGAYDLNLDALMFYGLPKAHFYVDAICYQPVDGRRIPRPRVAATLGDTPLFAADQQLQVAGSVQGITDNGLTQAAVATFTASDLKVVPNPTSGVTTIALDLDQAQNVELQIFSPAGQIVREISLGETSIVREDINLSDLANGLYILKATGENTVITKKIVLQK